MKKKLTALFCALVLLLALLPAQAAWDDELYFLAVNVKMMPLAEFMPIKVSGTYYVPYTAFDANSNGGNSLGIFNGGQQTPTTYTMYNSASKFLTFDLSTGNSYDYLPNGEQQKARAVVRSGKIYLSVSAVCNYFSDELDYSQTTTAYGYPLLRIKSKNSPLWNDSEFINAASSSAMLNILNEYYKTVVPQSPVVPISPSGPVSPALPTPPTYPTTERPGTPNRSGVGVSFALRFETGAAGADILDALRAEGRTALLLFTPAQLAANDDLVRRGIGEGHSIGLLVPGGHPAEARAAIEEGNALLAHIGRIRTRMILPDGADSATVKALKAEGFLVWQGNLSGIPAGRSGGTTATEVQAAMGQKKSFAKITMDDTSASATALPRILRSLRQEKYDYRAVVETEF